MRINEHGTIEMNAGELRKLNTWIFADEKRQELTWVDAVKLYMKEHGIENE